MTPARRTPVRPGLGFPTSLPSTPASPVAAAANNVVTAGCPPAPLWVGKFQAAFNGTTPPPATPLVTDGTYDDATVKALYDTLGAVAPCPSLSCVALAKAVVADTTICAGTAAAPNLAIQLFMDSYGAWQNGTLPIGHVPPPGIPFPAGVYTPAVQAALGSVLGMGTGAAAAPPLPTCTSSGGTVPAPPAPPAPTPPGTLPAPTPMPGGGGGGGPPPIPPAPPATTSNTAIVAIGVVGVVAVGALAWLMSRAPGTSVRAVTSKASARARRSR